MKFLDVMGREVWGGVKFWGREALGREVLGVLTALPREEGVLNA